MFRRRGSNPFPFILILFIFAPGLVGPYILVQFLPLILGVAGLVAGYKLVKKLLEKSATTKTTREEVKYSNRDLTKVDEKLTKYFNENLTLLLVDNIALTTASGKYTSLANLFVTYGSEKIMRLSELELSYPDAYDKIMDLLVAFAKQKVGVDDSYRKKAPEVKRTDISKAQDYINKLNELNDAIPHQEISDSLDQTCLLLKQIDLANVKDNDKLNKLYDYYLPILLDVLNKYHELEKLPIHEKEFDECENQLMKTIILINQALNTIISSLHEYEYMDLSADISTLQSILKKDGMVEDPFNKENK